MFSARIIKPFGPLNFGAEEGPRPPGPHSKLEGPQVRAQRSPRGAGSASLRCELCTSMRSPLALLEVGPLRDKNQQPELPALPRPGPGSVLLSPL